MDSNGDYAMILNTESLGDGRWRHKIQLVSGTRMVVSDSITPDPVDLIDWLSFRRSLLSSPEYPLAVALALESAGLALADAKLTSAIDACLNQGAEPEEVAAFQSALALYFGQLPMPEGVPIRDRIINLCIEHNIPHPDPAPGG